MNAIKVIMNGDIHDLGFTCEEKVSGFYLAADNDPDMCPTVCIRIKGYEYYDSLKNFQLLMYRKNKSIMKDLNSVTNWEELEMFVISNNCGYEIKTLKGKRKKYVSAFYFDKPEKHVRITICTYDTEEFFKGVNAYRDLTKGSLVTIFTFTTK